MLDSTTIQERRRGIGGSDAAKILGVSSWGGAFSVWQDKVNDVRPELKSDEAVHWGNVLEEVVAREFSEREHLQLRKRETVFSKEYPFMLANIDREIIGVNAGLECKTANAFKSGEWNGDNLPDDYYVQIQHYCSVMNWDGCYIACLIGGQKFVSKLVPRNNTFIKDMIEIERDFWQNYVLTKTPPALSIADKVVIHQKTENLLTATPEDLEFAKRKPNQRPLPNVPYDHNALGALTEMYELVPDYVADMPLEIRFLQELAQEYPDADLFRQFRRARDWLSQCKKPKKDLLRFLRNWLAHGEKYGENKRDESNYEYTSVFVPVNDDT